MIKIDLIELEKSIGSRKLVLINMCLYEAQHRNGYIIEKFFIARFLFVSETPEDSEEIL